MYIADGVNNLDLYNKTLKSFKISYPNPTISRRPPIMYKTTINNDCYILGT